MSESDPHELADQLEHEADRLQHEGERLGEELASTREEWEHKRADPGVPGAPPRPRLGRTTSSLDTVRLLELVLGAVAHARA